MLVHVNRETLLMSKTFVANLTFKLRGILIVGQQVSVQIIFLGERTLAQMAFEGFFINMRPHMNSEVEFSILFHIDNPRGYT